jgi:hypothetical protein
MIESIKKHGKKAEGRSELLKHIKGVKLIRSEAIKAKCYDCMGYYADGVEDCKDNRCPLYKFHPYRQKNPYKKKKR